jgi:hypothetical protein
MSLSAPDGACSPTWNFGAEKPVLLDTETREHKPGNSLSSLAPPNERAPARPARRVYSVVSKSISHRRAAAATPGSRLPAQAGAVKVPGVLVGSPSITQTLPKI